MGTTFATFNQCGCCPVGVTRANCPHNHQPQEIPMATRDPYIVEAARRLSLTSPLKVITDKYLNGFYDDNHVVTTLAATLKETSWAPPISPELQAVLDATREHDVQPGGTRYDADTRVAMAAIERYKALVPPMPATRDPQPLIDALETVISTLAKTSFGWPAYDVAVDTLAAWRGAQ
jgi:hypothetical protein